MTETPVYLITLLQVTNRPKDVPGFTGKMSSEPTCDAGYDPSMHKLHSPYLQAVTDHIRIIYTTLVMLAMGGIERLSGDDIL